MKIDDMRIDELKNQFLSYFVDYKGGSVNTQHTYDFNLSAFLTYLQSQDILEVESVTTEIIENYLFGLDVSIRTKALRKCSIASFFKYLHRKKHISNNPAIDLESIKIPQNIPSIGKPPPKPP